MPDANATAPARRTRRDTRYRLPNVVGLVGKIPVQVLDLSFGGIGLEISQPLRVGTTHSVTISGHGEMLELSGTVRWCQMSVARGLGGQERAYSAGMSFDAIRPEDFEYLYVFIAAELAERAADPEPRSVTA